MDKKWYSNSLAGTKNHFDDCEFCAVNTKGINRKNRNSLVYPNFKSVIKPIPHCNQIPIPMLKACLNWQMGLIAGF